MNNEQGRTSLHTTRLTKFLSVIVILLVVCSLPPLLYKDATRRSRQQRRLSEVPAPADTLTTEPEKTDSPIPELDGLSAQWARILNEDYRAAKIVWGGESYSLHGDGNSTALPNEIVCNDVLFTSHPNRRDDRELDEFRQAWSDKQDHNCFFLINVPPNESEKIPPKAARQWRKRTPKSAVGLVNRYRGGLVLMALIGLGRIHTEDGAQPWTLYVDSDTMMAHKDIGIGQLVSRVVEATTQSTVEEEQCFLTPSLWQCFDDDEASQYSEEIPSIVLGVSDGCARGYNTQSGAILFRSSALSAFVFEVLAKSPAFVIDTKHYQLGDQAIWDWLAERSFRMDWSRLRAICSESDRRTELLRRPCEESQFVFRRDYVGTEFRDSHWLLERLESLWTDQGSQPLRGNIAWNCVRWFNSPGCPNRRDDARPFSFRCGDPVWHLYGCSKTSWKHGALYQLLNSPECAQHLPRQLPPPVTIVAKKIEPPPNITDVPMEASNK